MSVMASVRAVARNSIPRPPRKSPITLTDSAVNRLLFLHAQHQRSSLPFSSNPLHSTSSSSSSFSSPSHSPSPPLPVSSSSASTTTSTSSISNAIKDYIKVSVRTKGCSGNAYTLNWVKNKEKLDEEVPVTQELAVLIESKALFTLIGSQMDYVEDQLSAGFVFNNPNVKETCGCGMSFIV